MNKAAGLPMASPGSGAGVVVVVQLLVDEERTFSLTFSSGYPSVAELFNSLQDIISNRLSAEQIKKLKIYFRLPHGGEHTGVASSSSALNWQSYLCIKPHTYIARIATRTPPSSPERPAGVGTTAGAAAAGPLKKECTVSDLCAALEKVVLADDGIYICIYMLIMAVLLRQIRNLITTTATTCRYS